MKTRRIGGGTVILLCVLSGMFFTLAPRVGHAQELAFSFTVALAGETSDARQFGLRDGALSGIDSFDVPEPPSVPGAPFEAYLVLFDEPAAFPNRWRHDFRSTDSLTADHIELWQFNFASAAIGEEVTIDINSVGTVPFPYELYLFGSEIYYEPITVPESITFTITSDLMVFFWELRLDEAVENVPVSWGGIKSLYR